MGNINESKNINIYGRSNTKKVNDGKIVLLNKRIKELNDDLKTMKE